MTHELIADDARQSLRDHCAAKGREVQAKYGPHLGWAELQQLLADRTLVRYPCTVAFDSVPLQADELAYPEPLGARPDAGFRICVHPRFEADPDAVIALVLYQLVVVNYGEFATSDDAEAFGSAALGCVREDYYQRLCALADRVDALAASSGEPA